MTIDESLTSAFGAHVYSVGGSVRDSLLQQMRSAASTVPPKDHDYVIVGLPARLVRERLQRIGTRVDAVGASFAVLKVVIGGETIDVAIARREFSTGAGHRDFEMSFGEDVSLDEDLARRDLTINAVARRLIDGAIFSVPGAMDDLRNGVLRAISPAAFREDPLRILRLVQLASRFEMRPDHQTRSMIDSQRSLISTISPERISEEMAKLLLKSPHPSEGMRLLADYGLLDYTIPELRESIGVQQNKYHRYDVWEHLLHALDHASSDHGDIIDLYAALLHDVGKPRTAQSKSLEYGNTFYNHEVVGADMVGPILSRLRMPRDIIATVQSLVRHHMYAIEDSAHCPLPDRSLRRFIARVGPENIGRQLALRQADVMGNGIEKPNTRNIEFGKRIHAILAARPPLSVTDLPISGHAVIALLIDRGLAAPGFRGDARVGKILHAVLQRALDDPQIDAEQVMRDLVDEQYACQLEMKGTL